MPLPLGGDPRTDVLRAAQAALIARFGRIVRPADKRRTPEWVLVHGVIGARSKTAVSNATTDALLAEYGSWDAVAGLPLAVLARELGRQTFPEQSARRLLACLAHIISLRGSVDLRHLYNLPTDEAMAWLEHLPGVGRKIAAGVMNTSGFARPVMVIDSHHRRIMQRMGLVPPRADTVRAYDALEPALPPEWAAADMDEHHLLLKRLGQTLCRPRQPDCADCPVRAHCATGQAGDGTAARSPGRT